MQLVKEQSERVSGWRIRLAIKGRGMLAKLASLDSYQRLAQG